MCSITYLLFRLFYYSLFAWIILTSLILNELFEVAHIAEAFTYVAATSLCGLHVYNLKYCQCDDEDCCVHQ